MKKQYKVHRLIYVTVLMAVTMWGASHALAGTVEGTIQGLNCVLHGKVCPLDKADPHVAAENVFVVLSSDKKYYFLTNIDRSIMARMLAKNVRVTGEHNEKYNAVLATKIEVMSNGMYKVKWTKKMEDEERFSRFYGRH